MEGLQSGYSFPLLQASCLDPSFIRTHYETLARHPDHWPCIAFSNHDVVRAPTRFGGRDAKPALARLLIALLISLRGTILLYQGEELGLPEAELRRDQLRDPVGDFYYPYICGRDGCRTPMPWNDEAVNLGFTTGVPWLPLASNLRELAVSIQEQDANSTLAYARRFLAARRQSAALRLGEIEFLDTSPPMLAFMRVLGDDRVLCVFNMSSETAHFSDHSVADSIPLAFGTGDARISGNSVKVGPCAAWFARRS
jgi:alpha-glucosidase